MIENRNCPGCGRHCPLSAPGCERGEAFARQGGPEGPNEFRRLRGLEGLYGPEGCEPPAPEGPRGPGGPDAPPPPPPPGHPGPHGPGAPPPPPPPGHPGPHGPGMPPPPPPPGRHGPGPHIDREHYEAMDTDGKLFTLIGELGHASRFRFDGKVGQGRVLSVLPEDGVMTQRELTERLGIRPGSASEIIGKLERAGLIRRTPSETDRRTADIRLTEAGLAQRKERAGQEKEGMAELFTALAEEEKQTLLSLLEKLQTAWWDGDGQEPPPPVPAPRPEEWGEDAPL